MVYLEVWSYGGAHVFAGDNSGGVLGISQRPVVLEPTPLPSQRWKTISLGGRHGAGVGDAVSYVNLVLIHVMKA